jgi:4-amino-4-deoxy-L-arabinose transferase-like glycosyltransferase
MHRINLSYLSDKFLVALIILLYVILSTHQIFTHSVTFDEPLHISSSLEWLRDGTSVSDPLSPPLSKLPFGIFQIIDIDILSDPHLVTARSFMIVITAIFLIFFYYFIKNNFSKKVALWSLFLLSIEPTLISYTHLANTEAITLFTFFLVFASGINLLKNTNSKNLTLFLITLILLYLTKSVFLPAFIFLLVAVLIRLKTLKLQSIFKSFLITILFFFSSIAILSGFNAYPIHGDLLNIPGGGILKTTITSFLYVTDPVYEQTRLIVFAGKAGHQGSIFYTPISLLLKTTPHLLILSLSFTIYYFWKLKAINLIINQALLIIFSTIIIVILGKYNIGVRHLLPIFPFLALLAGLMIQEIIKFNNFIKAIVLILIFCSIITSILIKDKITYFTPLIGSSVGSYLITESNFDWGQSLPELKDIENIDYIVSYSPEKPAYYGISASPLPADWQKILKN